MSFTRSSKPSLPPAEQNQSPMRTEPFDNSLIQPFASRRQQNQMSWVFVLGPNCFDTLNDRFHFDDHAWATAKRSVIHRLVFSSRPISEVV